MLYFVTGLPGASKTLNTIKMVCEEQEYRARPIYYNHIDDLTAPGWTEITDDDARQWYNLPHGSVVVIDEAHRIFPNLKRGSTAPDHYGHIAEIRHYGITMLLITQHAAEIDVSIRRRANRHYHYERQFGTSFVKQLSFKLTAGAITDTTKASERELAETKRLTLDKKYFGLYKSAEVHTVKASLPWKRLIIAVAALVVAVWGFWHAFSTFGDGIGEEAPPGPSAPATGPASAPGAVPIPGVASDKPKRVMADYLPRAPGLSWTAPAYDEVMQVESAPKPQACVHFQLRNLCVCYTGQATRLDVPSDICLQIVKRGWFDDTKPEGDTLIHRDPDRRGQNSRPRELAARTGE